MLASFLAACGGSKKPADDADDFEGEQVSEEQHKNEVDPFFEGETQRGPQKVDLQEDESEADED